MPQGVQAFNIGRIVVLLSAKLPETVNGITISRYCSSSLDAIRHAGNASRPARATSTSPPASSACRHFNERTEAAGAADRNENLIGEGRPPNAYIEMGITAVNVANKYGVKREDMDKLRAALAGAGGASRRSTASSTARSCRSRCPTAPRSTKDDGPRASSTYEKLAELPEAFGGGGVTAGNSCPLNDGAAAVLIMSDTKAKELGLTPRARIVTAATAGIEPELMGVAPIERDQEGPRPRRHDDRRHRPRRAERGVRRPGDPDHGRVRDRRWTS